MHCMKKSRKHRWRSAYTAGVRSPVIDVKRVEALPPRMTLGATFASVKPKRRPLDFKRTRDTAIEEHVEKVARRMRQRG